jgi:hypothetical protein
MTNIEKAIAYASWYIGRKEKPGNSGFIDPEFEAEMKAAGWIRGNPWCATFGLLIVFKILVGKLLVSAKKTFNASAKQTFDKTKAAGVLQTGTIPEPGAICIFLHGHGPAGHEGIVEAVNFKTNTMTLIEGNTNASGSREGDQVARKLRTITRPFTATGLNVYGYIYLREKQ